MEDLHQNLDDKNSELLTEYAYYFAIIKKNGKQAEEIIEKLCNGFLSTKIIKLLSIMLNEIEDKTQQELILKTTAEFYYLTISQLISKNKTRKLTTPREMCMYLMRELLDITFAEIGMTFSNRDHSTVMKACARVETKIKKDSDYKLAIDKLKEKLNVN